MAANPYTRDDYIRALEQLRDEAQRRHKYTEQQRDMKASERAFTLARHHLDINALTFALMKIKQ